MSCSYCSGLLLHGNICTSCGIVKRHVIEFEETVSVYNTQINVNRMRYQYIRINRFRKLLDSYKVKNCLHRRILLDGFSNLECAWKQYKHTTTRRYFLNLRCCLVGLCHVSKIPCPIEKPLKCDIRCKKQDILFHRFASKNPFGFQDIENNTVMVAPSKEDKVEIQLPKAIKDTPLIDRLFDSDWQKLIDSVEKKKLNFSS